MTITPEMRDLAQRLLAYEADAGKSSISMESPTLRACEKLRQCLVSFAGVASFQSIAVRALVLAQAEVPSLCTVQVTAEGSLQGLGDVEFQSNLDKDLPAGQPAGEDPPGKAGLSSSPTFLVCFLHFLEKH
jgi:hypothetical protein